MKLTLTTFPNWKGFQGKGEGDGKIWAVETGREKKIKKKKENGRLSLVRTR